MIGLLENLSFLQKKKTKKLELTHPQHLAQLLGHVELVAVLDRHRYRFQPVVGVGQLLVVDGLDRVLEGE